ncbi:MAG: alanine dehydrogenase [Deltaproteobacteria bacterium]|nr:alanine dehydrogenase [Deltaproteobacteria bacterium]
MIIGVLKEIKAGENRIALSPAGVRSLRLDGHRVLVETDGGSGSGFSNDDYAAEGAGICTAGDIYGKAELIVKVKEPLEEEWPLYRKGQVLFTYLHLASSEALTRWLLEKKIVGIAYETVEDRDGLLPLLTPMSEVAGRMSVQLAARFLEKTWGGRGILLSGVPGVPPAEVVILGGGIAGVNAAKVAVGQGAHVTILDVRHERLKYIDDIFHGTVITLYSNPYMIEKATGYADVLIGAVLITGARAPVLVTEDMVCRMKPGSVIVDISIDQGGSVETIRPTTHADPIYTLHNVIHCGVPNIPAAVPRTSTFALTNATLPYIRAIADKGLRQAALENDAIACGINCAAGKLIHPAVAAAFGMDNAPWHEVLPLKF